jgi:hypothetical protein
MSIIYPDISVIDLDWAILQKQALLMKVVGEVQLKESLPPDALKLFSIRTGLFEKSVR